MADEKGTDTTASAESETSSEPTLTSLLEDWEKGASKAAPKEEKSAEPSQDYDRVAALEYKLEMKEVIPAVKGEVPVNDKFVETYINMRASEDSRLDELWKNRNVNRSAWDKAIETLGKEFKSFAEASGMSPKKQTSERRDDKGLAAAAHMARESKPTGDAFESIDWSSLNAQEFAMKKSQYFRALKAGQEK